jgi:phosphinothricin acetyltransferase
MSEHTIVHCTFERHANAILEIFNDAILNSTALYDYKPRAPQSMVSWFDAKRATLLQEGALDADQQVIGQHAEEDMGFNPSLQMMTLQLN